MTPRPRIVLVTGAEANTGYSTVRRFAAEGARVYLHSPSADRAAAAAARLNNETGLIVHPLAADFRHPPEITALFAHIEQDAGGLDVLVNNAVDLAIGYSFIDTPLAVLSNAIAVNLTGVFLCSQLGARLMLRKQQGVIIHLGSITSDRVTRNRSAYVSTKGAIESLTRAMAVELAPLGIRVNCVAPGHIHTTRWHDLAPDIAARRRSAIPLGREATPEDVADAIHFLASDQAHAITGIRLPVDGGSLAPLQPREFDV
jgi:NAD(P)-dependent dehydrogenase (short-subunit alcohol dehydrogenase family)